MKLKTVRITRKTPLWLVLLSLFIALAQQQGWLDSINRKIADVPPGTYRVMQFVDGDTISVDMNGVEEKIRMIGVDTPETHDPRTAVQCFGKAASEFTRQTIGNNAVRLEADPLNSNRDRYDRLLRYVYLPDGRLMNIEIIRQGYGFAYTSFPFGKIEEFKAAEKEARGANRGLWESCNPEIDSKGFIRSNPVQQ